LQTVLIKAAENHSNKILCLGIVSHEKPPGWQEIVATPATRLGRTDLSPGCQEKPAGPAWPSFIDCLQGWPGLAYAQPAQPGLFGTLDRATSSLTLIVWIAVDQELRANKTPECK